MAGAEAEAGAGVGVGAGAGPVAEAEAELEHQQRERLMFKKLRYTLGPVARTRTKNYSIHVYSLSRAKTQRLGPYAFSVSRIGGTAHSWTHARLASL